MSSTTEEFLNDDNNNLNDEFLEICKYSIDYPDYKEKIEKLLKENNFDINYQDSHGNTGLMYASKYSGSSSSIELVQLLLELKANVNLKNRNRDTAFTLACFNSSNSSSFETVKLLKEFGADIDTGNSDKYLDFITFGTYNICSSLRELNYKDLKTLYYIIDNKSTLLDKYIEVEGKYYYGYMNKVFNKFLEYYKKSKN